MEDEDEEETEEEATVGRVLEKEEEEEVEEEEVEEEEVEEEKAKGLEVLERCIWPRLGFVLVEGASSKELIGESAKEGEEGGVEEEGEVGEPSRRNWGVWKNFILNFEERAGVDKPNSLEKKKGEK